STKGHASDSTASSRAEAMSSHKLSGQQKIDIAAGVLRGGDFREAIRLGKKIAKVNPEKRADANCIVAISYCALGELDSALIFMNGLSGAHLQAACKKCNEKGLMAYSECVSQPH